MRAMRRGQGMVARHAARPVQHRTHEPPGFPLDATFMVVARAGLSLLAAEGTSVDAVVPYRGFAPFGSSTSEPSRLTAERASSAGLAPADTRKRRRPA